MGGPTNPGTKGATQGGLKLKIPPKSRPWWAVT